MMLGMNSFAVPKASSEPLPELAEFLKPFAPLFRRRQSRRSLDRYITGLLTDLGRKNCQTIASAVAGTSTERLQHLLTDAEWDPLELDAARVRSLSKRSPKGGILILDDTSLPKGEDRKSTRLNSSHANISYAVFCLKKKKHSRQYL